MPSFGARLARGPAGAPQRARRPAALTLSPPPASRSRPPCRPWTATRSWRRSERAPTARCTRRATATRASSVRARAPARACERASEARRAPLTFASGPSLAPPAPRPRSGAQEDPPRDGGGGRALHRPARGVAAADALGDRVRRAVCRGAAERSPKKKKNNARACDGGGGAPSIPPPCARPPRLAASSRVARPAPCEAVVVRVTPALRGRAHSRPCPPLPCRCARAPFSSPTHFFPVRLLSACYCRSRRAASVAPGARARLDAALERRRCVDHPAASSADARGLFAPLSFPRSLLSVEHVDEAGKPILYLVRGARACADERASRRWAVRARTRRRRHRAALCSVARVSLGRARGAERESRVSERARAHAVARRPSQRVVRARPS